MVKPKDLIVGKCYFYKGSISRGYIADSHNSHNWKFIEPTWDLPFMIAKVIFDNGWNVKILQKDKTFWIYPSSFDEKFVEPT